MANKRSKIESNHEDETISLPSRRKKSPLLRTAVGVVVLLALFAATTVSLRLSYSNKLYPGSWGNGLYLGGLTRGAAVAELNKETTPFVQSFILLEGKTKTVKLELSDIKLQYRNDVLVDQLMNQGRTGSLAHRIVAQWQMLLGISNRENSVFSFDTNTVAERSLVLAQANATNATNAHYQYQAGAVKFIAGTDGGRLDYGRLALALSERLSSLNSDPIDTITTSTRPAITTTDLTNNQTLVESYVSKPLILTYGGKSWPVDPNTMLDWLHAPASHLAQVYQPDLVNNYYAFNLNTTSTLAFDNDQINTYLTTVSKEIDQAPVNAQLTVADGKPVIGAASKDGQALNIPKTRDAMLASLSSEASERTVAMTVDAKKADINEGNLASLGLNDLLSEGITYFPGSPPNRLINVRTGAARFNGVLLKPDEVFSFGDLLGPVGAEQGYVPGLIILADHEEMAYGGGLCQVSSTAYRAALLAGLPILERTNHAFAISYYTAPYGVPGVDATIYYPPVDMKFRNDTGAYLLIQTKMVGTTLTFDYYGTKKKEGVIRGPYFVTGNLDVTKPSQTVFYRDVLVNGQVVKTDTVNTFYKSSLDFPVSD